MQNKSLPWREFCELVVDTGIYSSQVSSFAGGYRYLYSSIYKIGECPRSCLFPWKIDHMLGGEGKKAQKCLSMHRDTEDINKHKSTSTLKTDAYPQQ